MLLAKLCASATALLSTVTLCATAPTEPSVVKGGNVVGSVALAPDTIRLEVGDIGKASCQVFNRQGSLLNKTCSVVSRNSAVATTTSSNSPSITAKTLGQAWIVGTHSGKADSLLVLVVDPTAVPVDTTPAPPPVDTTPTPPPVVASLVDQLIGPVLTLAETPAGPARQLDSLFLKWSGYPRTGDACSLNYYDAALHRYAYWKRTGIVAWRDSARLSAVRFRDHYLAANAYQVSPHCAALEGVAVHAAETGDPLSVKAVCTVAKNMTSLYTPANMGTPTYKYTEGRIQERLLKASLLCGLLTQDEAMLVLADRYADNAITLQRADGSYSWKISDYGVTPETWGTSNFMLGLQNDALIKYYRLRKPDSRIPVTLAKAGAYLWTQWDPTAGAFKYWSTSTSATSGQVDVSQLIAGTYAWLWAHTGDAVSRDRYDEIERRTVTRAYYQGLKQFNQQYHTSFQSNALRYGRSVP